MGGIDNQGHFHQNLASGSVPIPFPHRAVAPAYSLQLKMPEQTMLCCLTVEACKSDGAVVACNFLNYYVSLGYPPSVESIPRGLILRGGPGDWAKAEWSIETGDREKERAEDACYGVGHGFFEWALPINRAELAKARRLRVLCEASSHRLDTPQTDEDIWPTLFQIFLNDVRVYEATLRNHPHDSRGILSYLRGGKGAYGYLAHALAENDLLREIIANSKDEQHLLFRCAVPKDAIPQGGLTIYGSECGRFPVCPTVVIEY
jgi:hypothetical protein